MRTARPPVTILGAGGLARALARALAKAGVAVTIASRRPAAAAALARTARGLRAAARIDAAIGAAGIVVLAVPDHAIRPLARALAPMRRSWRGVAVLHAAGAYGPDLLSPLASRGASTGVFHPLAVLGGAPGSPLSGAFARIEGAPKAREAARRIAAWVGVKPLHASAIATARSRAAYHAAASLASNDVVALIAAARAVLVRCGVPEREAEAALVALASGALAQARDAGLAAALTGPVARNDAATLTSQIAALSAQDRAAAAAHRALSLVLVELAADAGRLDARDARALTRRLRRGRRLGRTV